MKHAPFTTFFFETCVDVVSTHSYKPWSGVPRSLRPAAALIASALRHLTIGLVPETAVWTE